MKRSKRVLSLVAAGALVMTAACSSTTSTPSTTPSATPSASQPQSSEPVQTAAVSGVYEGKGTGYGGEVSVLVTVEDGQMTDLRLLDHHETDPVVNRAFPILKDRILEAQSPVVDSVTSATYTSFAVKAAVADAASQYGQDFGEITMTTASAGTPAAPEDTTA